ncbi:hypothetical protein [Streptomyces phaeochromogenes]|uniref:hypothetical protein n=1 Tax=Streptomyces phaeochromogenes TaxID=1923 RepID=UPI002DDA9E90|nr:hypothetical protein [Streptomyces phaeochromogenes]WRZ34806.1 hypothetical protein OG931_47305 [Streptomyces phaeochromogenes]
MELDLLNALAPQRRADVRAAVCAVETAMRPVAAVSYRALAEVPLRMVVQQVLAASGRTLLAVGRGFLSGYDDGIRKRLASEGIGVLPAQDRAVLTLVLLYSVAVPRAAGTLSEETLWTQGRPVARERLKESMMGDGAVDAALRRLGHAGLVHSTAQGFVLGPQFLRLTVQASASLFEELVVLAEPQGALAESIQRRRRAAEQTGPDAPGPKEKSVG